MVPVTSDELLESFTEFKDDWLKIAEDNTGNLDLGHTNIDGWSDLLAFTVKWSKQPVNFSIGIIEYENIEDVEVSLMERKPYGG